MSDAAKTRILHLFANYKWTGPADPAIRTAARLRQRGLDVRFAQAGYTHPGAGHPIAEQLARWQLPAVTGMELRKHIRLRSLRRDVVALRAIVEQQGIGLVHCHLPGDHLTAALALRRIARPIALVRSFYEPTLGRPSLRERYALRRTHAAVAPTSRAAQELRQRLQGPADCVLFQEPVTEPREIEGPDLRLAWGVAPDEVLVGITARIQPHRRFDLLWQTADLVRRQAPRARFVLLGRGNEVDTRELVEQPIARLGLGAHVLLPGYQKEPHYSAALRSLDAFLFLVPGSDGTCRAVRDAMAFGLPVVATQRGILAQLFAAPGEQSGGMAVPEQAEALAAAVLSLVQDEELRRRVGAAALSRTRRDMDPERAAAEIEALYGRALEQARKGRA